MQSVLSEHRSPSKAVTTRTVAGVGLYAGAKSPPKWINNGIGARMWTWILISNGC